MFSKNPFFPTYTRTSIIYLGCIVFCIIALGAMPYLKTDVSVRASALIRPAAELNTIRSIASGRVREAYLTENKKVKAGDVLYVVESETLNEQEKFYTEKIELNETLTKDAEMVIEVSKAQAGASPTYINAIYNQTYFTYRQKLSEAQTVFNKAKQAYNRQYKLFQEKVIAAMEFENFQFELKKSEDAIAQLKETH
ncbi:MAG: biotin/lipoyl-binding protein [Flammeovirgaceae bacterium]